MIQGEPERTPNTRGTGSGFICIILYIYLYVCLWGDHFSEERVKFLTCKVMVVMRMHAHMPARSERQLECTAGKA